MYEDAPDFRMISEGYVTARKDHTCDFCGRTITKGQQYHRAAYVLDGEFTFDRGHVRGGYCADMEG